jgi:hypothetical protein
METTTTTSTKILIAGMEIDIFEYAMRNKCRFPYKGLSTTEDLYDLNVEVLDTIFQTLDAEKQTASRRSLLDTKTNENIELAVKIAIIEYIVVMKQKEKEAKLRLIERKKQKNKILEVLSKQDDANLENTPREQLMAMLNELDQ